MARTTNSVANDLLHREGLEYVVHLYSQKKTSYYKEIAPRTRTTKQRYIKVLQAGDLGMMPVVGQLQPIGFDDFSTPYSMDARHYKRALGYAFSTESSEEDLYNEIQTYGMKMALSSNKTKEQAAANMFNLADAAATNGPDAVPWASNSHPYDGGVQDNLITTALGITALETAVQTMKRTLSHRGDPEPFVGPFMLMVPPELEMLAKRLVNGTEQPQTANRETNQVRGSISSIHCNPYFTGTTAWGLKSANADEQGCVWLDRRPFRITEDKVPGLDGVAFFATEIFGVYQDNWRGFLFSTGTGA